MDPREELTRMEEPEDVVHRRERIVRRLIPLVIDVEDESDDVTLSGRDVTLPDDVINGGVDEMVKPKPYFTLFKGFSRYNNKK